MVVVYANKLYESNFVPRRQHTRLYTLSIRTLQFLEENPSTFHCCCSSRSDALRKLSVDLNPIQVRSCVTLRALWTSPKAMSSGGWILRALRLNMAAVIVTMTDGEKKKWGDWICIAAFVLCLQKWLKLLRRISGAKTGSKWYYYKIVDFCF